jgi:hypothetical protein
VAQTIGDSAFQGTGGTGLTLTLGAMLCGVGTNMFSGINVSKTVTVMIPSSYIDYFSSMNWSDIFMGRGWNGTNYYGNGAVNSNIILFIQPL